MNDVLFSSRFPKRENFKGVKNITAKWDSLNWFNKAAGKLR